MFLSDTTIQELIDQEEIVISPPVEQKNLRPTGVRIHLSRKLITYEAGQTVDPMEPGELKYQEINLQEEQYILKPGSFVLGSTRESFKTPRNLSGFLDGRCRYESHAATSQASHPWLFFAA